MQEMPIFFCSGLPRAGSTLLQNLLAQNPFHHCTATNDLIDIVTSIRDKWMTLPGFIAQGLENIEPRIVNCMRGCIYGFFRNEFESGKVVFDKSRGHLTYIELLERILGRKIKIIVPVRDVRDIIASFEKIHRESAVTEHPVAPEDAFRKLTIGGRAERLCAIDNTVGYALHALQDALDRGLSDRLIIVPYRELTHDPVGTIKRICRECGIPEFTCDPSNVEQKTKENDTVYGMDLHTIKSKVIPDQGGSWKGVLPEDLAEFLNKRYTSIQMLSQWHPNRKN